MAQPAIEIWLTDNDKELLLIAAELIVEGDNPNHSIHNLPSGFSAMSDKQADRLANHLDIFLDSPEFRRTSHFSEGMTDPASNESELREIYLSERKKRGRSRAMATNHWLQIRQRIGLTKVAFQSPAVDPMEISRFIQNERKILFSAGFSPRVVEIVLKSLKATIPIGNDPFQPYGPIKSGAIRKHFKSVLKNIYSNDGNSTQNRTISINKLSSIIGLVVDTGVMFTTRDLTATGTLSQIASYWASLSADES